MRLAFANVRIGVAAVFGDEGTPERKKLVAELSKALPELRVKKILELPELGRALLLAAQKVAPAPTGEIAEKLAIVQKHRAEMLDSAELLAKKGLLPKDAVAAIRAGTGKIDMADDGVALVDLFEKNAAAIAGKHPFTPADLEELRAASEWLLDRLAPRPRQEGARQAERRGGSARSAVDHARGAALRSARDGLLPLPRRPRRQGPQAALARSRGARGGEGGSRAGGDSRRAGRRRRDRLSPSARAIASGTAPLAIADPVSVPAS